MIINTEYKQTELSERKTKRSSHSKQLLFLKNSKMKNLKNSIKKFICILTIVLIICCGVGGVVYTIANLGAINTFILIGAIIFIKAGATMLKSINLKF